MRFVKLWNNDFKEKYKANGGICACTWIDEGVDENAVKGGYFKTIEETKGKSFDPAHMQEFQDYFYFGHVHQLAMEELAFYPKIIMDDFASLWNCFIDKQNLHP